MFVCATRSMRTSLQRSIGEGVESKRNDMCHKDSR